MRVVFDRPFDGQVWERATLVAGWVEGIEDAGHIQAVAGEVEIPLGACVHPRAVGRSDLHGFWTEVILQRHVRAVRGGMLPIDVYRDRRHVARTELHVSPVALELARSHPLDLDDYSVPPASGARVCDALVFPGLGAVGGSSLNALFRRQALRAGHAATVYGEANTPSLWSAIRARPRSPDYGWIDGHGCYAAADARALRVTLLREPIQRLVSVFNYGALVHPEQFRGSFDDLVASGAARAHSQAVGLLRLAVPERDVPRSDGELIAAARAELARSYALVGLTERFEETIFLMCRLAGRRSIGMWWRVLAAPRAVEVDRLDPRTRALLERDLAPDLALYEEARAAFDARVAAASLGADLQRYRDAAGRRRELSAEAKAVECLRWRHVLAATP